MGLPRKLTRELVYNYSMSGLCIQMCIKTSPWRGARRAGWVCDDYYKYSTGELNSTAFQGGELLCRFLSIQPLKRDLSFASLKTERAIGNSCYILKPNPPKKMVFPNSSLYVSLILTWKPKSGDSVKPLIVFEALTVVKK